MGNVKNIRACGHPNVDQVDTAPVKGRSADEPLLESTYPVGVFMYADIGRVEIMADVAK